MEPTGVQARFSLQEALFDRARTGANRTIFLMKTGLALLPVAPARS
jgi:hypothetical protein